MNQHQVLHFVPSDRMTDQQIANQLDKVLDQVVIHRRRRRPLTGFGLQFGIQFGRLDVLLPRVHEDFLQISRIRDDFLLEAQVDHGQVDVGVPQLPPVVVVLEQVEQRLLEQLVVGRRTRAKEQIIADDLEIRRIWKVNTR